MRYTAILFILCVLLSCEHPQFTDDLPEQPAPSLTVSIFQIEHTPFAAFTRTSAAEACNRLCFAVYDKGGPRVKEVNQKLGDDDFGTASFQIPEGTYLVVAVAHNSAGNPTMTNPAKIHFTNADGYSDTFYDAKEITVTSDPQTLSLSLRRNVALCRFVITDDYPDAVAKMRFRYTGGSGAFDSSTGLGCVKSTQTIFFDVTGGQKQFDLYTFLHNSEGTIHLLVTAYDEYDNVIHEREFDILLKQNEITWLKGAYFSGKGNITIGNVTSSVDISTTWSGQSQQTY